MTQARHFIGDEAPRDAGRLLAEVGTARRSFREQVPHWTVVRVYTSNRDDGYVADVIGRSARDTEPDIHEVHAVASAEDLIRAMHRVDDVTGEAWLPRVRYAVLDQAAEESEDLANAMDEYDEAVEAKDAVAYLTR